jgi:hypothetical protein
MVAMEGEEGEEEEADVRSETRKNQMEISLDVNT